METWELKEPTSKGSRYGEQKQSGFSFEAMGTPSIADEFVYRRRSNPQAAGAQANYRQFSFNDVSSAGSDTDTEQAGSVPLGE